MKVIKSPDLRKVGRGSRDNLKKEGLKEQQENEVVTLKGKNGRNTGFKYKVI